MIDDSYIAVFELGIKLGALYHQFIGMPINPDSLNEFERAIEASISAQPYVVEVDVEIDESIVRRYLNRYGYAELNGEMLRVRVVVSYGGYEAEGVLEFDEELNYPLMRLTSIKRIA